MPEPVRDLNQTLAQKRRVQLDTYLQEVWKLKKNIRSSSPMKRFLLKQTGDIETSIGELGFDSSDTLLDLITEYDQSGVVKFKLCLSATTEDYVAWRDTDTISYSQFMDECCVRASRSFIPGLAYKDETSTLIRLMGDEDLRLLTRTNAEKLIFYILENPDSY